MGSRSTTPKPAFTPTAQARAQKTWLIDPNFWTKADFTYPVSGEYTNTSCDDPLDTGYYGPTDRGGVQ